MPWPVVNALTLGSVHRLIDVAATQETLLDLGLGQMWDIWTNVKLMSRHELAAPIGLKMSLLSREIHA